MKTPGRRHSRNFPQRNSSKRRSRPELTFATGTRNGRRTNLNRSSCRVTYHDASEISTKSSSGTSRTSCSSSRTYSGSQTRLGRGGRARRRSLRWSAIRSGGTGQPMARATRPRSPCAGPLVRSVQWRTQPAVFGRPGVKVKHLLIFTVTVNIHMHIHKLSATATR